MTVSLFVILRDWYWLGDWLGLSVNMAKSHETLFAGLAIVGAFRRDSSKRCPTLIVLAISDFHSFGIFSSKCSFGSLYLVYIIIFLPTVFCECSTVNWKPESGDFSARS